MKRVLPQYADELDRSYQFEVDSRSHSGASPSTQPQKRRGIILVLDLLVLLFC